MLDLAKKLLEETSLCDHCLGRQFALVGYGITNQMRGVILRNAITLDLIANTDTEEVQNILLKIARSGNQLAISTLKRKNLFTDKECNIIPFVCELCEGLFDRLNEYTIEIKNRLLNEDYNTFLIGAKFTNELLDREDNFHGKYQITSSESIKAEFTRELGKKIAEVLKKNVDFDVPDITAIIDFNTNRIVIEKRSLFIYGRYKKYIRTIPQTRWPCYDCKGKGCKKCNFTGKQYQESVEEIIAEPIIKTTKGKGSKFHGAGREDINALMLGNGRPFVLEILEPEIRTINLEKMEKLVNKKAKKKVSVIELSFVDKKKVQELKGSAIKTQKTYRAIIELEHEVDKEKLTQIENEFNNLKIKQKTPQRVLHRRSDLERIKTVYKVKIKAIDNTHIEAEIIGEGGLYIKELISGDNGRTKPSFAEILGCDAVCVKLDVIHLHSDKK
ncbi:MAG: tRNA pseudouridine(54/55) synthase Pus10 [Candidatus Heimdallarchaeota archaeon]|nr:tRNA pseudouridine(54/55) synthase Pus10 [Candidatus Heimdallarchaeota archaeon]